MFLLAVLLLAILSANGQPLPVGKPVTGNFGKIKPEDLIFKAPHIHMPHNCKGESDHVFASSGGTYYACIKEKDVCSQEKGAIPAGLIADFDARMREHEARMKEFRARTQERLAASGDSSVNHREMMARHEARVAQARQGRTQGAGAFAGSPSAPTTVFGGTVSASTAPPPPEPIAEELVNGISVGTARSEVIGKLGEPYMKISGGVESFTYRLTSGNTAKLEFENGKLTQLRIVPGR